MTATGLVLVLLSPLLLINLVFITEVVFGLARLRREQVETITGRTVIIVPAHDEELGMAAFLASLKTAAGDRFDILVVADNCTDRTASIVRDMSVPVVERHDPGLRGKGYALAFARDVLREDPPAGVIILDADCFTNGFSLAALAAASQQLDRATQAIYLLEPSVSASPLVQVSSFAFLVGNLVRQRGLQRLTGSVHLTGTGMCLPWRQFDAADLATSSIVEDLRLGIELARSGAHPQLVEDCIVWSPHADESQTLGQRSRWEGGFLALAGATAPGLIGRGLATLSPGTLFAGLDLLVPPLALLAIVDIVALLASTVLAAVSATSWLPALVLGTTGVFVAMVLLVTWWKEGRPFLSTAALLQLPLYPLWKIPMYFKLARSGAPKSWNRTERQGQTDGEASPPTA